MDSEAFLEEAKKQISTQHAIENAKELVDKINKHCFEKCVPKPGTSLSSTEQNCATQCIEKYSHAWGQVSLTYVNRLQRER
ncbi:Tim10/DDP family zinc finger-domain-containing protein [Annulohypoxylon nitens]|nr:Tim10/DDP family zinc finger-domain-containing protein [Annulohypoxylon nitens]KAI1450953.1 Tim10/DDP family zinc finger-domain-containing protein [Annulohypoxylon stygium]